MGREHPRAECQWQRCDRSRNCTNVEHANGQTYTLTSADSVGRVTVVVTATDQEGQATPATAQPVG